MKATGMVLLALSAAVAYARTPAPVVLQGHVVSRVSRDPVSHASVVAARVGGAQEDYRVTTSDTNGRFIFADLTPGDYRVYAQRAGFVRSEHGSTAVAPAGQPIALADGASPPDISIAMTPTGVISGRVTDRNHPASGVWVRALRSSFLNGRRMLGVEEYAVTDDRGEYRIFDLPPGSYLVSAIPATRPRLDRTDIVTRTMPGNANSNRSEERTPLTLDTITAAAFDTGVYPASYYPSVTDPSLATVIDVAPGSTTLGTDVALTRAATFRVSGVVEAPGMDVASRRVRVWLTPAESGTAMELPAVEVPLGGFGFPRVPPGRYRLRAQLLPAEGERQTSLVAASVPVDVWDRDASVTATLQPGVTISGRILVDKAPPPGDSRPSVQLQGLYGMPGTSARRVEADGSFELATVAPGTYHWRLLPMPLANGTRVAPWVTSARFGNDDVSSHTIEVGPGAATTPFVIEIGTRTASLIAIVIDDTRRPVAGAVVIAVPAPARRSRSEAYRDAVSGPDGRVKLDGLPPGEYWLLASERIAAGEWQDPVVFTRHEPRTDRVRLAEAETKTIELRVLR